MALVEGAGPVGRFGRQSSTPKVVPGAPALAQARQGRRISASFSPPALYYPNCNACSTFGKHYRQHPVKRPPLPPQAAELVLRILPPKLQQPWGPKVVPLVNQSRKRPQAALPENRSRKIDGLAGSPPCMDSCNIFHSGCNRTTTTTGGTHSTL